MWVVINKELDEKGKFKLVEVFGSIKAVCDIEIVEKNRILSYNQLYKRLSKNKPYSNDKFFIRYCKLIRSTSEKK